MSDFDGARGTLSLAVPSGGPEALDDFGFPLRRTELIARNVGRYRRSFLGDLPGFIYIRDFDPGTRTGRLEYRNTELGFTSLVAQGVADLNDTGLNVFYSVPFGERAGIWVTRKK
jgi:hypothetical protein